MTLNEFINCIAQKRCVTPCDKLQQAACVALLCCGAIKVAHEQENNIYYSLNHNVEVSGENGKYTFHILPCEQNNGKQKLLQVDAQNGKFSTEFVSQQDQLSK